MVENLVQIGLLILGFALLVKGADFLVDGAVGLALSFGVPQIVVGLTVVSMGTSLPEAAVSIAGALKGSADVTIGNVLGSNIINILIILGISALVRPLGVGKSTIKREIPFLIFITAVFLLQGLDGTLGRADGLVLWLLFALSWVYLYRVAKEKKDGENTGAEPRKRKLWLMLLMLLGGMALITVGSDISVDAAINLAAAAGISERLIALTVVALGTSLPELFTSVTAARRGNSDIAIGNIVGSNIFNILFVAGSSALITAAPYGRAFLFDAAAALLSAVLLFAAVIRKGSLNRKTGFVFLAAYAAYLAYLLL